MSKALCRWGILGTAEIARKNWLAIRNASNCTLTAVASRTDERCRQFIEECQRYAPFDPAPHAFGSYEAMLQSDLIDAVYIPLPTGIRKEWVIRAAEAGKHVLAEKPSGVTVQDVREMLNACRQNNVQFMDGVMFMHSRRMEAIRNILDDGQTIGEIRRITSQFCDAGASSEAFGKNIRAKSQMEPFGCLGDLGWYTIRFILWAMRWKLPQKVTGHTLTEYRSPGDSAAIPIDFSGELFFADGISASFYCSFAAQIQQWINIAGLKGSLQLNDFVLPIHGGESVIETYQPGFAIHGCDFIMEDGYRSIETQEHSNSAEDAQETNMFCRFSESALSGCPDESWGEMSLKTQQVMDACFASAKSHGDAVELP